MTWESTVGSYLDRLSVRRWILAVYGAASTLLLLIASPLGWDEAVYSSRAKDLAESNFDWGYSSGSYWSDQRAPGFSVVQAFAFRLFGTTDFMARALVVLSSIGLLYVIARTLDLRFPRRVGTSAIAVVVVCPGYVATATLAFADIPAAFVAAISVFVILHAYVRDTTRYLFVLPIVLGIATTMRFGAVMLVIAPLLVVAVMVAVRTVRRRDWKTLTAHALAGVCSVAVVLVLLTTRILTKNNSPMGAKSGVSGERPADQWLSDLRVILKPGPVDYGFGGPFWGWSYAVLFAVLVTAVVARMLIARKIVSLLIYGSIALVPVLLYGVTVRQFVTTYLAPLFAFGAAALVAGYWQPDLPAPADEATTPNVGSKSPAQDPTIASEPDRLSRWLNPDRVRRVALATFAVAYLGVALSAYRGVANMHDRLGGFDRVRSAAFVADDLLGSDCRIVTGRVPQVVWYSDCTVAGFSGAYVPPETEAATEPQQPGPVDRYVADQAARVGAKQSGDRVGFLLLDGLSGEPRIDDIWSERIQERSVVLYGRQDRRVAVLAFSVP